MSEFDWIRDRFDRVDDDNAAIKADLKVVSEQITKHATYWSITKWIGVTLIGASTSVAGFFGIYKH